jgi:hypothetical protein
MTEEDEKIISEINSVSIIERLMLIEKLFQTGIGEDDYRYYIKSHETLIVAFKTLRRMIENDGKI